MLVDYGTCAQRLIGMDFERWLVSAAMMVSPCMSQSPLTSDKPAERWKKWIWHLIAIFSGLQNLWQLSCGEVLIRAIKHLLSSNQSDYIHRQSSVVCQSHVSNLKRLIRGLIDNCILSWKCILCVGFSLSKNGNWSPKIAKNQDKSRLSADCINVVQNVEPI